ncbi:hypothetical protein CBE01nite_00730 [Clostridium beijerinckii]|uniref:Uncharacterized protein n=2 Tax=Clostridium beijerinckii TaxID=1520 RepID=A0AB74VJ40_CLOBE|nr:MULTISPECIES: hypothetical protein [Clostridium]NRT77093.1 hypothetical protein [Clostridium beijerinckii]NRZ25801.1 hypothetical protein [Clostridium beijerinckii]NSB16306.1 hypothetical protein [Clostridium beijerinckii]NYB98316.1 hypothetical protein [Clostridium beijerinckii]OOM24258.1 hypothetical protein CLBEI_22060 [Clostridium beijerinckii]
MSRNSEGNKFKNIMSVGNFTKHAVENFEENIVNQRNYLEKVKENEKSRENQ